MFIDIFIVSLLGLAICLYGLFIERRIGADPQYKAVCDLSDKISCTKTFLSPWNKILGISNIYIGMLAYIWMAFLAIMSYSTLIFITASLLGLVTLCLAYILFVKTKIVCPICILIYIVNGVLFVLAYKHF